MNYREYCHEASLTFGHTLFCITKYTKQAMPLFFKRNSANLTLFEIELSENYLLNLELSCFSENIPNA